MRVQNIEIDTGAGRLAVALDPAETTVLPTIGQLSVNLVAGPNGSGKTTLMSALVRLFHNLDWYQERIGHPITVKYKLHDELVAATWTGSDALLGPEDGRRARVLDARLPSNPRAATEREPMLPHVIASVFSTRGEYPRQKLSNYRGLSTTSISDLSGMYGQNHYEIGSLSLGIRKLISDEMNQARELLANVTGLTARHQVRVFPSARFTEDNNYERQLRAGDMTTLAWSEWSDVWGMARRKYPWITYEWLPVDDDLIAAADEGDIYINDLQFTDRHGRDFSLMNLSAGQKTLLVRLLVVLSQLSSKSLIVIEEPELHLDPVWCDGLMPLIGSFWGHHDAHVIMSTQSMALLRSLPGRSIVLMDAGMPHELREATFFASESVVADSVFRGGVFSLQETAILERLPSMTTGELNTLLSLVGEGPLRFALFSELVSRQ
jgi:energy-coupling factor transporter ATP-binding protein EcfA2